MQTRPYERICITIPIELAKKLRLLVPRGQRNRFIVRAIEEKLKSDKYDEFIQRFKEDRNIMLLGNLGNLN